MRAFSVLFFLMGLLLVATAGSLSLNKTYTYPEIIDLIMNNELPGKNEEISKLLEVLGCPGGTCIVHAIRAEPATDTNEAKNSVEDYVQGCGPRDENSYEANETFYTDDISKRSAETDSQNVEANDVDAQIAVNEFDADEDNSDDANMGDRKRREAKQSDESNSVESDESKEKKTVAAVAVIEAAASAPEGEKAQETNEPSAAAAAEEAATVG